jgi:hypothetical protein
MRQRGRKSADNLVALAVSGEPPKLIAPAYLSDTEATAFAEIIDACAPGHLRLADVPLLVSMVQATLLARSAGRDPDKLAEFERAARLQAMLATKLRLTVQSRTDPKTIGRQQMPPVGPLPWEAHSGG